MFDANTDALIVQITTGNFTTSVGIDFLRHLAYASNQGFTPDTDTLLIIDTNTNTVIEPLTDLSLGPVAVNPLPTGFMLRRHSNHRM